AIFAFTWSFNNYEISAFTIGFQQTFPVWVYSSVRNPDHTAVVNAISAVISIVQVALITVALMLLRARTGDDVTRGMIAGTDSAGASVGT
ncbi:MAG: ABC transporter permease, partial [Actinomycetota bacterium]